MPDHPYKLVLLNGHDRTIRIDVEIVDLVMALNNLEWYTAQSCQDNVFGRVWISFIKAQDATYFLNLIACYSDNLRECVLAATTENYDKHPNRWKFKDRWWIDAFLNTFLWRKKIEQRVEINISVRFPREHLEEVTSIVVKHANKEI